MTTMTSAVEVYIAAPFCKYQDALDAAAKLRADSFAPLCTWATDGARGKGKECFDNAKAIQTAIRVNDAELGRARILLALTYPDLGGEMFAEIRLHLYLRKPVIWVKGRSILSMHRPMVTVVENLQEALVAMRTVRNCLNLSVEENE